MTSDDLGKLKKELETYETHKSEFLGEHEGKYVLIHGGEIAGFWDTFADALHSGYEKYKLDSFLVKQVQAIDRVNYFSRDLSVNVNPE